MVLRRTPIIISRNEFVDIEMNNHIDDHSVGKKTQARKKRGANSRGLMLTEIADLQLTNHLTGQTQPGQTQPVSPKATAEQGDATQSFLITPV